MFKYFLLFTMIFSSFFSCQKPEGVESVSAEAFAQIIANDTTIIRLDVRTAEEYAEGHIEGSINIDVLSPDFEQKALAQLPKDKKIALYCRSGNRSKQAMRILANNGYNIVELNTGVLGWMSARLPLVR